MGIRTDELVKLRLTEIERVVKQLVQPKSRPRLLIPPGGVIHAKTPAGGIAGMTGLQMASASCDLYDCSGAGLLSDSGENETIYNPAMSAIAATTLIVAAKNSAGIWVAIVEDCG